MNMTWASFCFVGWIILRNGFHVILQCGPAFVFGRWFHCLTAFHYEPFDFLFYDSFPVQGCILINLIFVFFVLSGFSTFVVAMVCLYQTCVQTDLTMLHYVIFIELFGMLPTKSLSFNSNQITLSYENKIFESNDEDPFLLLEEHFFEAVMVCKKYYDVELEDLSHEVVEFFS
jgi:hypothetical protein